MLEFLLSYEVLKVIWWVLIGVLLIGFAVTDGMDIGAALLLPLIGKTDHERRSIINTVGPHWDGNQVWLITAGGAIFAAWPVVYAVSFSGFYMAILLTLFALFFRPVGFDYRSKLENSTWRSTWDWALFGGSLVPALVFGVAFGNLLQGVPFTFDEETMRTMYPGNFFELLNPYALIAGILSIVMLAVHGGTWLVMRADEVVAERAKKVVFYGGILVFVLFALAGLLMWVGAFGVKALMGGFLSQFFESLPDWTGSFGYTIVSQPDLATNFMPVDQEAVANPVAWKSNFATYPIMWIAPILGLAMALLTAFAGKAGRGGWAFLFSSLTLAGIIMTAGFAMFPFVMPSSLDPSMGLTLWNVTSSHLTLKVMFFVALVMVPIVLAYTIWAYAKMWRRVTVAEIKANEHTTY